MAAGSRCCVEAARFETKSGSSAVGTLHADAVHDGRRGAKGPVDDEREDWLGPGARVVRFEGTGALLEQALEVRAGESNRTIHMR